MGLVPDHLGVSISVADPGYPPRGSFSIGNPAGAGKGKSAPEIGVSQTEKIRGMGCRIRKGVFALASRRQALSSLLKGLKGSRSI